MILQVLGILIFIGVVAIGWFMRRPLNEFLSALDVHTLSMTAGCLLLVILLPLVEGLFGKDLRLAWRRRFAEKVGISATTTFPQLINTLLGNINAVLIPFYMEGPGQILFCWFEEAGFGSQPYLLTIYLIGIVGFGSLGGYFLTGSCLLSVFSTLFSLGGFCAFLFARAKGKRRLFQDQFPGILDRLADSLQAGFSFSQAIHFFASNLSEPGASEMNRIFLQMRIGFSVEEALAALHQRRPTEDVRLLAEGISLQRQVGGNMVEMIREIAGLIRERVELENEIRTLTAQGRLSAVVIALLVPVSIGLLSMFPGYIDVLFGSTIGNLVLIASGTLELMGAVIVMRLIRIEV